MHLPTDAVITREKLTLYLLVPRRKNDKSRFLAQAGFSLENPDVLEVALRRLIAEHEAISDREDAYGVYYRVEGNLHGPDGILRVITIWIRLHADGTIRFVTLKPVR